MNKRTVIWVLLVSVLASLCAACGARASNASPVRTPSRPSRTFPTVAIQTYPGTILNLPTWIATGAGFCRKNGLNCVPTNLATGPLGEQALAGGTIQIAFASTDVTMSAVSHGADLKIIAASQPNNLYTLVVKSGISLPNAKKGLRAIMEDLKGKTIGVSAIGSGVYLEVRALFAAAGINPNDATYVAVGATGTQYDALLSGKIAADVAWTPIPELCRLEHACKIAVELGKVSSIPLIANLNGAFETYAVSDGFLKAHVSEAKAFVKAIEEADAWAKESKNLSAVERIAGQYLSLAPYGAVSNPKEFLDAQVKKEITEIGAGVSRRSVKAFSNYLLQFKQISAPVSPSSFVAPFAPELTGAN